CVDVTPECGCPGLVVDIEQVGIDLDRCIGIRAESQTDAALAVRYSISLGRLGSRLMEARRDPTRWLACLGWSRKLHRAVLAIDEQPASRQQVVALRDGYFAGQKGCIRLE